MAMMCPSERPSEITDIRSLNSRCRLRSGAVRSGMANLCHFSPLSPTSLGKPGMPISRLSSDPIREISEVAPLSMIVARSLSSAASLPKVAAPAWLARSPGHRHKTNRPGDVMSVSRYESENGSVKKRAMKNYPDASGVCLMKHDFTICRVTWRLHNGTKTSR